MTHSHVRAICWAVFAVFTAVILLFPVNLVSQYHPIQAPHIFTSLPVFSVLFCSWLGLLLLLVFYRRDEGGRLSWENLALASLFGLVFLGFWVVITPYGRYADAMYNMGHVRYLMDNARIPVGHPNLGYFDYPGMHLLVSALCQITGLGVFESATAYLMLNAALFPALLYVSFVRVLNSNWLAFLGVLLVIMGSTVIADDISIFYPRATGYTLLAAFLILLSRSDKTLFGATASDQLIMLVLFAAMVVTYFAVSFLATLILLGICAIQVTTKDRAAPATARTVVLLLIAVFAWEIYWTWHTFHNLAEFLPRIAESVFSGESLATFLTLGSANVGGDVPLWATATRFFWWALLGLATIVGLSNLRRLRRLSFVEKTQVGGMLGVVLLTVLGLFGTVRGNQFARYLMYAPLFCAPILLASLLKSGVWGRRALALLTGAAFALALPTFLFSVNTIATDAIYSYETTCGEFLELRSHEQGQDLDLFRTSTVATSWAFYYVPNTSFRSIPVAAYYGGSSDDVWNEIDKLVSDFEDPGYAPEKQKMFVISEKGTIGLQHLLGSAPDDPGWQKLKQRLGARCLVYDNGHVQMYASGQ